MNKTFGTASVIAALLLSAGCGGAKDVIYENGGAVDLEGWPVRESEKRLRCPESASLEDQKLATGGRRVACLVGDNPIPRGFAVEWHPNGQLAMLFTTSEEGDPIRRTRYFDDGQKQAEESFVDGRVQSREQWYENGQTQSTVVYGEEMIADVERWQPDGTLQEKGQKKDGLKFGAWIEFVDGALEQRTYDGGVLNGPIERKYLDGSVEVGRYKDGLKDGVWSRTDPKGVAMAEQSYADGLLDGEVTYYHPNRQIRETGTYSSGAKNGLWKEFHPTGQPKSESTWACDKKSGGWQTYHPTGTLASQGSYHLNKKVGEWRTFSQTGEVEQIDTFAPVPENPLPIPASCKTGKESGHEVK